jgi:tripartite-type tricarboxylate transporter receptor subunit TctC
MTNENRRGSSCGPDRRAFLASVAGAATLGLASGASAQGAWPTRQITIVVPFAPGGNTDTLVRLIGGKLASALGQPVVAENKPGAGGNLGSDFVAKARPDGYTFLGGTISSHAINASLYTNMPYDAVKSFEPVILIGTAPLVLAVNASSPLRTAKDLVEAARAKPGSISFATAGNGTSTHIGAEMLASLAGVKFTSVPYRGSGPAVTDVMAGHVPAILDTALIVGSHVKAGKLRALAVASPTRIDSMPDVPTAIEAGLPAFEIGSWQAIFAPAGTPKEIVERMNREIAAVMKLPDVKARFDELGFGGGGGAPSQLADLQRADIAKYAKVIKDANIKPE